MDLGRTLDKPDKVQALKLPLAEDTIGRQRRPVSVRRPIDLIDALSHPHVAERLATLTADSPRRRLVTHERIPASQHGSVLEAVISVLPPGSTAQYIDVHARVEQHLGRPVPKSSVKNVLSRNSRGIAPKFTRLSRGLYRGAQGREPEADVDSAVENAGAPTSLGEATSAPQ